MLFNSYTFIFAFLPVTLLVFVALAYRAPRQVALSWLVMASLFYYGWARPQNLLLLGVLLVLNYGAGVYLGAHSGQMAARIVLAIGVAANLGVLGYFKYANLAVDTINAVAHVGWPAANVVLPLGISFFIFQKIAYLVDASRGRARGYNFVDYCLFVTFFPQLIAGPIVHHAEVVPQFTRHQDYRPNAEDFSVGLTQLCCGLFKKVVVADRLALYVSPIFNLAHSGTAPLALDGWIATLAYTFQLYFDFSGYSDIALGLGRLFGIRLPQNFNSPYQAVNITEFWRRWHMTLSRFLRDYLYIPLGGNRKGPARRYLNLMLTMLLGGLWHGAGWNFVFWGGLHGVYLITHHAWLALRRHWGWPPGAGGWPGRLAARAITFLAVALAWVFFRAGDFATAGRLLGSMFGLRGFDFGCSFKLGPTLGVLGGVWLAVWFLPNSQQWLARSEPALNHAPASPGIDGVAPAPSGLFDGLAWQPNLPWALAMILVALFTLTQMSRVSEFIYWQF